MVAEQAQAFLTAEWPYMVMLNYEVPVALLEPYVPRATEVDQHDGRAFLSLVGFRFLPTRVLGCPLPGLHASARWADHRVSGSSRRHGGCGTALQHRSVATWESYTALPSMKCSPLRRRPPSSPRDRPPSRRCCRRPDRAPPARCRLTGACSSRRFTSKEHRIVSKLSSRCS